MNILQGNITKTLIITFILGVVISLVLGPITIPLLRRLKFGQNIREDGPKTHLKKAGTPTMGGVIFILSTTIAMFIVSRSLTDKGLASTVSVLVLTFFAVLTFTLKDYSLTVFSVALIAGLLGFLKYNAYPAKVFMGDTGSLAIGGAITTIAIISGNPLIIVLVGGIYVCEALSVFKMAPIHHHFEQCGWNEVKIVTVFSIITVLLCIIGFFAI